MCRGFTSSIVNDPLNLASIQCQCPTACSLVRYIDDGAQAVVAGRGRGIATEQGVCWSMAFANATGGAALIAAMERTGVPNQIR